MVWNDEKDELLCREIFLHEPYQFRPRTQMRGAAWKKIADNLSNIDVPQFRVDARAVRERFGVVKARHEAKMKAEISSSGTSPELTPLDRTVEELVERIHEVERVMQEKEAKDKEQGANNRKVAEDIRKTAMETFAESKKRSIEDQDKDKPKKARSNGSDTLSYLREKAEIDKEKNEKERELREKELEFRMMQYEGQQQQQKDMFVSMMDQINKSNQQMMLVMAQLLQNKQN